MATCASDIRATLFVYFPWLLGCGVSHYHLGAINSKCYICNRADNVYFIAEFCCGFRGENTTNEWLDVCSRQFQICESNSRIATKKEAWWYIDASATFVANTGQFFRLGSCVCAPDFKQSLSYILSWQQGGN